MAELTIKIIGALATGINNVDKIQALLRHHEGPEKEMEPLRWQMHALLDSVDYWHNHVRQHPEMVSPKMISTLQKMSTDCTALVEETSELLDRIHPQSFWSENLWPLAGKPAIDKMSIRSVEIMGTLTSEMGSVHR